MLDDEDHEPDHDEMPPMREGVTPSEIELYAGFVQMFFTAENKVL